MSGYRGAEGAGGGRVLVVRFGSLGDVVLSFAAAAALARGRPGAEIAFLVKAAYADLVRAQPWAARVLALEEADRGSAGARRWRARLAAEPWDAVLDLQGSARSRYLARGLTRRLARWRGRGLARRLVVWSRPLRRLGVRPPAVRPAWLRFHDAAARLGAAAALPPRVRVPEGAAAAAAAFLADGEARDAGPLVAVAPAAAWPTKEWPEASVLALAEGLAAAGHRLLFVSTAGERGRLAELDGWVRSHAGARWFSGDLPTAAALLARARVAVAPDSGLLHLAAGVGTPTVALFGCTAPELGFAPAGLGHRVLGRRLACRPCAVHGRRRCPLGHLACLRDLSAAEVLAAVGAVLAGDGSRPVR